MNNSDKNVEIRMRLKMLPDYPSVVDELVTDKELEKSLIDGINSSVDCREERRLTEEERKTINDFFLAHFKKD
jgi:hypothetical protein